jgi:hypothetical protein
VQTARAVSFTREEFLHQRWNYRAGEHVSFIAPTQWGKTTLAKELLDVTATPDLQAVILVVKPRDGVVRKWTRQDDYKLIRHWPPSPWTKYVVRPSGLVLWPKHTFDPDVDNPRIKQEFRRAILDSYRKGNKIVFADEVWGLVDKDLGLAQELTTVWTRGASSDGETMGCGLWGATQRPAWVPLAMYSQAEHMFLGNIPDAKDLRRVRDFGGEIPPGFIEDNVLRLKKYEWLYIRRTGPFACIVQP